MVRMDCDCRAVVILRLDRGIREVVAVRLLTTGFPLEFTPHLMRGGNDRGSGSPIETLGDDSGKRDPGGSGSKVVILRLDRGIQGKKDNNYPLEIQKTQIEVVFSQRKKYNCGQEQNEQNPGNNSRI